MTFEDILIFSILVVGWPVLIIMSYLIIRRGSLFYKKLQDTALGRLIKPTIFGWLFGLYSLGIVSTAYMLSVHWYYTVIPAFIIFLIAIQIVYRAMRKWEEEASELKVFYGDLESLVFKRTSELEEAHQKAINHEKEIQKLKDQFVYIAAHELKTPVTAIRWGIENALNEGKNNLDPELVAYLTDVQDSNARLINLVNDLLNVAQLDAGTIKIDKKNFDFNDLVEATIKEMDPLLKEKSIEVEYINGEALNMNSDPERLKQIIINLLGNAIKYNRENGKVWISTEKSNEKLKVSVSDTGYGISEKNQEKLFKKFSRIQTDKTRDIQGTGLGLYLCKEIVEKLGGEIGVESEMGKGSTFWFTVPF